VDVRKIPAGLVDKAHERGLIYSDERANLVFKRDGDTGCFKRGSYNPKDRSAFKQTLGRNGKPFKLKGTDGTVYVTEGPIDALALKAMHPSSTVLATGGNCPPEALRPYFGIATQHLYAAHDGDDAGNVQAYRLMAEYIGHFGPQAGARVERHSPGEKKDWSAVLMASPGLSKWGIKAEPAPVTPMPDIIQTLRAETARRQAQAVQPKLSQEVETPPALPAASVPPQPTPSRPITPSFRPPKGPGMGP
jgi:hypothetical protein